MLVRVEKLVDTPVVLVTYRAPFKPHEDITQAQTEIAVLLEKYEGILYRIDDLSEAEMSWNQFVDGIYVATRDVPGSMVDARIQGMLVGQDRMVKMASESMKQRQYGATDTPMFNTVAAALNHVQLQLEECSR